MPNDPADVRRSRKIGSKQRAVKVTGVDPTRTCGHRPTAALLSDWREFEFATGSRMGGTLSTPRRRSRRVGRGAGRLTTTMIPVRLPCGCGLQPAMPAALKRAHLTEHNPPVTRSVGAWICLVARVGSCRRSHVLTNRVLIAAAIARRCHRRDGIGIDHHHHRIIVLVFSAYQEGAGH